MNLSNSPSYLSNTNPAYIESLYAQFKENPGSLAETWQKFFEGYEFSKLEESADLGYAGPDVEGEASPRAITETEREIAVVKLINAYRERGHLIGQTSPVGNNAQFKSDLRLEYFGLSDADLDHEFEAGREIKLPRTTLREILNRLVKTYCSSIGPEFRHCHSEGLRQWLYNEMEPIQNTKSFSQDEKKYILNQIDEAVSFENFLQTKFVGKKRFSLEGLEVLIPALDAAVTEAAEHGVREFVLGMAHRGRLNVLTNIFGKSYDDVFTEFGGVIGKLDKIGGDVKYHLGQSSDIVTPKGKSIHLTLVPNPSHLEAVNPVVQGLVYAKSDLRYELDRTKIIPVLIHGDAAFAGQGVNYELANMSKLKGFSTMGTVHVIMNNQIGFTTLPSEGRSSVYCTDLAKVTESPVFHVNGDDPEAVVHAIQMAIRIRQKFAIDVYVDVIGYRRYGHNEGDEPRFTQPRLYKEIERRPDLYEIYKQRLIAESMITEAEAEQKRNQLKERLQNQLDEAKTRTEKKQDKLTSSRTWHGYRIPKDVDFESSIDTGFLRSKLNKIAACLYSTPKTLTVFNKMQKILSGREDLYVNHETVDWGLAELLAYGTCLLDKMQIRLCGQDTQRGTFSHRHAIIRDLETEEIYLPLNHLGDSQARIDVLNSSLSEYAVLGFEFGYSMARPDALVIWEAQFGDFANGAQIIIDQYLATSQVKWGRMSGLTLFLPHGYEGQGPEHSSARIERFLELCAKNNMYVVNPTTPANLFHMIRRQVKNKFRIPLIVFTPKSLLRHPKVQSRVSELESGRFLEVLDDPIAKPKLVTRVILCSGKVYYDLLERQADRKYVAIVRLEQLYPLPIKQLEQIRQKYSQATTWIWAQEEPQNFGPWSFLLRHLSDWPFQCVARNESPSPATGNENVHIQTQRELVAAAFGESDLVKKG